jgi:hypothetical protein
MRQVKSFATLCALVLTSALACAPVVAALPDAATMKIVQEGEITWTDAAPGIQIATVYGNPSQPHFHPEARYIAVLKGTWWVGAGPK